MIERQRTQIVYVYSRARDFFQLVDMSEPSLNIDVLTLNLVSIGRRNAVKLVGHRHSLFSPVQLSLLNTLHVPGVPRPG